VCDGRGVVVNLYKEREEIRVWGKGLINQPRCSPKLQT
jgi:hypothetical protein